MNKKKVKELRKFVELMFPEKVGDRKFFRVVKESYKRG
jgi:hypothetical protein